MRQDDQEEIRSGRSGPAKIRLETARLCLRRPHRRDLPAITREIGKVEVARYLATVPHPYSFIDATNWFGGINADWGISGFTFGIYKKTDFHELIGVVSISNLLAVHAPRPVLGYWLAPDHWGHGVMSEAIGALLAFAFERLNAPLVEATYLDENPASGQVMVKNGFQPVSKTLLWSRYNGSYLSGQSMRIERDDWQSLKGRVTRADGGL